ncbi:HAD hydrolase-like protein [Pengzhenrongella sicca]|uniref:HAD hydrolase-like protein n=1 Tax=Pengzhenrongella sicca TaxID=2819238 RepID=A0A8A4ZI36_9MICO|nr:HAD hydrolase-like protein [Pengzhenrongella sicca]QTE30639.1 HAD hydrolase-like protein [Pengzhenrongella sicca]
MLSPAQVCPPPLVGSGARPYDAILFDLDGTLTDPEVGITASFRSALDAVGRSVPADVDLSWVIGPPIRENLGRLGVTAAELPRAVAAFRRRHLAVGLYEATLIPGIAGLLSRLDDAGVRLALATAKPAADGAVTLTHFGLAQYFAVIAGNTERGTLSKADVVAHALRELGGVDPARVIMVGDRRHDIEGAAANGIAAIGVGWGFAADGELAAAGAARVATTVGELAGLLLAPAQLSAGN